MKYTLVKFEDDTEAGSVGVAGNELIYSRARLPSRGT